MIQNDIFDIHESQNQDNNFSIVNRKTGETICSGTNEECLACLLSRQADLIAESENMLKQYNIKEHGIKNLNQLKLKAKSENFKVFTIFRNGKYLVRNSKEFLSQLNDLKSDELDFSDKRCIVLDNTTRYFIIS